jgi:hypothetical protein
MSNLKKVKDYIKSIRFDTAENGTNVTIIEVIFPIEWKVNIKEVKGIEYIKKENTSYFISNVYDEEYIYSIIGYVADKNIEIEEKNLLLKSVVNTLKDIFQKESIEFLKKIRIEFDSEPNEQEEIEDELNVNISEEDIINNIKKSQPPIPTDEELEKELSKQQEQEEELPQYNLKRPETKKGEKPILQSFEPPKANFIMEE